MIVLGFDTATPATVVGLRLADGTTLQARDDPPAGERPGHTTRLLPLASELLAQAGSELGAARADRGGRRAGHVHGPAHRGRHGPRAGAVAGSRGGGCLHPARPRRGSPAGARTRSGQQVQQASGGAPASKRGVLAAVDARRGEAFVALYAGAAELAAPCALRPEELASLPVGSAEGLEWLAVGDGAVRFRGYVEALGVAVAEDSSPLHRVDAGVLCELALAAPAGAPEAVLPDYRRLPDAEIALEKSAGK